MTIIKKYDAGEEAWRPILVGKQGPAGGLPSAAEVYLLVAGDKDKLSNGQDLVDAYEIAKTMTPYGFSLSEFNSRVTILVAPGTYEIGSEFEVDADFINVLSLDGERSVLIPDGINVTASSVHLRGIDVGFFQFKGCSGSDILVENCSGLGSESFGYEGVLSGTFINCSGGDSSFGSYGTAAGTFKNCTGGEQSFASSGNAEGTFIDCTGGTFSFGGEVLAGGTFTNCTGGDYSFGGYGGTASGTFNNCTGLEYSFGGEGGTASGTFIACTGGNNSFGSDATGVFTNCTGGSNSFGDYLGDASGVFTNCTGGASSFGGNGMAGGTFTNCTGGDYSFASFNEAYGTFNGCIGGDYSFATGGTASGTFNNCTGGFDSFGKGGTLSGFVLYCRLTSGTFETPSIGGKIRLSLDGDFAEVNEDEVPD
jgi:hypothetical protein